jgi:cytochrome P450/NADPH-cytochrome P450 reductase
MAYKAGDYLAVLPINNQKNIRRVLKWANLPWDAMLSIKTGANTTLPTGHPISAVCVGGESIFYFRLSRDCSLETMIFLETS